MNKNLVHSEELQKKHISLLNKYINYRYLYVSIDYFFHYQYCYFEIKEEFFRELYHKFISILNAENIAFTEKIENENIFIELKY